MLAHRTQARLLEVPMAGLMPVTIEEAKHFSRTGGTTSDRATAPFGRSPTPLRSRASQSALRSLRAS